MKFVLRLLLTLSLLSGTARFTEAGNNDLEIHSFPKKIDSTISKGSEGGANRTKEHWIYELTIENKTFHDLANLEVKYLVLHTHEQLGVKADAIPQRTNGTFTIDGLKAHEKKIFKTNPVELSKANLVGNWIYSSGAKPNAQDALVGIVLHVNQGAQLFAEFANPPNLAHEKVE